MRRLLSGISFGLFALVFILFAFQNSDAQGCSSTYRVGQPASFTYSNSSALQVEWRLQATSNANRTITCTLDNNTCSSNPEVMATATPGHSVLTINQMQTSFKSVYVVVDGVESTMCRQLKIYAQPESIACSVERNIGYTNDPQIRFSATKFFPAAANIIYFMSNGTTIYRGPLTGSITPVSTSNGNVYSVIESKTVPIQFLLRGTNSFFITLESGYGDLGVNCSIPPIDIYPAVTSFSSNTSTSVSFNSSVALTCNFGPVPAETITLSRRGTATVLNTTRTETSITYVIPAFGCSDLDEYMCTVDNNQWSKASKVNVSTLCPPITARAFQNNVTLTTENGGSIFIPFKVISYTNVIRVNLWILEDGKRYAARTALYATYTELTSAYFYDINVALHDVHDADFRDYVLVITNGLSGDGISYFFTASQKSSVDVRGVAIGVGVVAIVLLIAVVVIVLLVYRSRRRRASHKQGTETEMVKPQNYDSTDASDASWGIDRKAKEAAAPKSKMPPRPVKPTTSRTEPTYEPMSENSNPHRPPLPTPPDDVYEIEPNGDSPRPHSDYGNTPDLPIYGNV